MSDDEARGMITAQCPFCDWSARQQVETEADARRVAPFLAGALDMHVQMAHHEQPLGRAVDMMATFRIETVAGVSAIRCLLCHRISELPGDVEHRYCGRCHLFLDSVAMARRMHADGVAHVPQSLRRLRPAARPLT
jgi:hypothetical protein